MVARFNWFNGGGRALDMVDAEDSPYHRALPSYRETWVYGNVIDVGADDPVSRAVHYGGDSGNLEWYRKGTLYFFNNTIRVRQNREDQNPPGRNYSMQLFVLDTAEESAEVWNNALLVHPFTGGQVPPDFYLYRVAGNYHLGDNVFSDNVNISGNPAEATGTITGAGNVTRVPAANFNFSSLAGADYRPSDGSALVDAGSAPPVAVPARHALNLQYNKHVRADGRPVNGAAVDVGALESGPGTALPTMESVENQSLPVITGTPQVGSTLTASEGTWTNNPTAFSYQWRADDTLVGTDQNTYVPRAADVGKVITVTVTASRDGFTSGTATSAPTGAVTAAGNQSVENQSVPVITGTPQVGSTLTASEGTWTNSPTGFSYQWRSGGVNVGADQNTYVPVAADVGNTVTVTVTASRAGFTSGTATSAPTGPVTAAGNQSIENQSVPVITGTPQVGSTLTASEGTWSNSPTGFSYQWRSGGVNVGADQNTYVPVAADVGNTVTVTVTASRAGFTSGTATSAPTGAGDRGR